MRTGTATLLALSSCNPVKEIVDLSSVVATEDWVLYQTTGLGVLDSITMTLSKHQNQVITSEGTWICMVGSRRALCTFSTDLGTLQSNVVALTHGSGTAHYIGTPAGSSDFTLTLYGACTAGVWGGSASIKFTDAAWNTQMADTILIAGSCIRGTGVTQ